MHFYGSYERKHILLGTHTGKPVREAKSCSAHVLRPFRGVSHPSAQQAENAPSPAATAGRLQNVPKGKEHIPSELLLLQQTLFI